MSFFEQNPELLLPFRAGQRDVLEGVYRAHVRGMQHYLYSLSRSAGARKVLEPSALADLLQDVFIRAFLPSSRESYDGIRDYRRYLGAIARNCFVDALKARGREVPMAPDELVPNADACWIEDEYTSEPRVRTVLYAYLADLPPALASVYRQRFVLGLSQDETSDALGLTRRQLRTAEERLRSGLRRALQLAGVSHHEIAPLYANDRRPTKSDCRRIKKRPEPRAIPYPRGLLEQRKVRPS